jgi:DNA-binding MarR family transcriptional regulator
MRWILTILVPVLLLAGIDATSADVDDTPTLSVGVTGSSPAEPSRNPTEILRSAETQALVLAIAERPHSRAEIEAAISGQDFTVDDMVAVGLLRSEAETYWIDFNLLRVQDQLQILAVSEDLGRNLAAEFLERRSELEAVAKRHKQTGEFSAEFLYLVLGCFSLDWDGLDLTEERGWRLGAQRTIDGHEFTPWAKERGAEISLQGLYWGSHNDLVGDTVLTTFGDHHSLPRFGLPDLLWLNSTTFQGLEGLAEEKRAAALLLAAYEQDVKGDIARVMMELGREALSARALAERTTIDEGKIDRILAFLEAAEYVVRKDGSWQPKVLVLRPEDAEPVAAMVAMGREIMVDWHEANYARIRQALSDLTPIQNGVPFERVYTEIWHFVFGFANRTLVEQGFFANPYEESRRYRGFLPVVWDATLAETP